MPREPKNYRALPSDDFRRERAYLSDECFAIAPPKPDETRHDPVDKKTWDGVMVLPTDALLRTTDHLGAMLADAHDHWSDWIEAMPLEPQKPEDFMFDAALDGADELHAAPFIAAHGYYRQATAGLRNAIEGLTTAAAFAIRGDNEGFRKWRDGTSQPRFGTMVEGLEKVAALAEIDERLGGSGLFGRESKGVLRQHYASLCRYAHSRPGHTNGDIWQSNGPIFVGRGFTQFWIDFGDTVALCYVLYKIGRPQLELPDNARSLFGFADERWDDLGSKIEAEFFPADH